MSSLSWSFGYELALPTAPAGTYGCNVLFVRKAKIVLVLSSGNTPITFKPFKFPGIIEEKSAIFSLPKTFWIVPTFPSAEPSPWDLFIETLTASLYSPLGTNLSSRSLFILDFRKLFLTSAI